MHRSYRNGTQNTSPRKLNIDCRAAEYLEHGSSGDAEHRCPFVHRFYLRYHFGQVVKLFEFTESPLNRVAVLGDKFVASI